VAFEKAQSAYEGKLLVAAGKHIKAALAEAPKSSEALKVRSEVDKTTKETEDFLAEAKRQIGRAMFAEAGKSIGQIEQLQADLEGLEAIKLGLPKTSKAYQQAMKVAESLKKDLGKALQAVNEALSICPESGEALKLSEAIRKDQAVVQNLLEKAKTVCKAAEFDKAKQGIGRAKELWPSVQGLTTAESEITAIREKYHAAMSKAKQSLAREDFATALANCNKALEICPDSAESGELSEKIRKGKAENARQQQERERRAHERSENFRSGLKKTTKWGVLLSIAVAIIVGVVIGAILFWNWWTGSAWPWCNTPGGLKTLGTIVGCIVGLASFILTLRQGRGGNDFLPGLVGNLVMVGVISVGVPVVICLLLSTYVFGSTPQAGAAVGLLLAVPASVVALFVV